jgi:low temperature requirement protein LtrA
VAPRPSPSRVTEPSRGGRVLRDPVEQEVSPLELLFDLVFVLGVSQLTRHLIARPTWRGATETFVLYLPMFAVWAYTSWAATLYSLSQLPARRMVIAVMVAGLFMNASLERAFGDAAWLFVATFLAIQLGRTAWMLTTPLGPVNREHFVATFVWLAATSPVWIAGAAASANVRLGLWGGAAAIDLIGIWLAHPLFRGRLRSERVEFAGEHLIERCRLFLLIALGETVATPGAALATAPIRLPTLAGGGLALAGTLCLWWLYFHAEPLALRHVARTRDRVYASRMGTNGLLFMIAGLIALAAGNALVIRDPSREATLAVALMLCGGPGIFLLARGWYQRRVFAAATWPQLLTIAALAGTVAAVRTAPALLAALAVVAVLVTLVIVEQFTDTGGSLRGPRVTRSRGSATAEDSVATRSLRPVGRVGDAT